MAYGPGVSPDSVDYLMAAENIISGKGIVAFDKPLTHFPPLYPLIIAFLSKILGLDTIFSAQLLSALALGINILLIGLILKEIDDDIQNIFLLLLFFTFSYVMFSCHTMAWTEPIFLNLTFSFILILNKFIRTQKIKYLIIASILAGISSVLRYAGISLIITIISANFYFYKDFYKKLIYTLFSILVSCVFPLAWFIRNYFIADSLANRSFVFHFFDFSDIMFFFSFSFFLLPITHNYLKFNKAILLVYILAFLSVALILFIGALNILRNLRKYFDKDQVNFLKLIFLFNICYMTFLIFSKLFIDAHIPFDYRILLPSLVTIFSIIFIFCLQYLRASANIWPKFFISAISLCFTFNLVQTSGLAIELYKSGVEYNSLKWHHSETMNNLQYYLNNKLLFSNVPDAIWFVNRISSRYIPTEINIHTRKINATFAKEFSEMFDKVLEKKAVVIYFRNIPWRKFLPSEEKIVNSARNLGLQINFFTDGIIIVCP